MLNLSQELLLQEIFMPASDEILTERFSETNASASCSGKCQSGHCISRIDTADDNIADYAC